MGYTTTFEGEFKLNRPLTKAHATYLTKFAETRRMRRDPVLAENDPLRLAVGLPIGDEAEYFVGSTEPCGQDMSSRDVLDHNYPPRSQPGLWCQWVPSKDGSSIVWDENEKFYDYVEWLRYLCSHFFQPWGYVLNGTMEWQGEEMRDRGTIVVVNNEIAVTRSK